MSHIFRTIASRLATILLLAVMTNPVIAQLQRSLEHDSRGFEKNVSKLTVTAGNKSNFDPFRFRLKTMSPEQTAGNAAAYYTRAFADYSFYKTDRGNFKEFKDDYSKWSGGSITLADIPLDKLKIASSRFDQFIKQHIEPATRCNACDWGYNIEDLSSEKMFDLALSDIHATNHISWVLTLQTRVAILEHRYEDAIELLKMHYTLARNVAKLDTVVAILTANHHFSRANMTMMELVAAPDSPNMYWALSQLPRPMISGDRAVEMQTFLLEQIMPEFAHLDSVKMTEEQWITLGQKIAAKLHLAEQSPSNKKRTLSDIELKSAATAKFLSLSLKGVTTAKTRLLSSGVSKKDLSAMSVSQIMLVDARHEYLRARSEFEKSCLVPIPDAIIARRRRNDGLDRNSLENNLGRKLFSTFGPMDLRIRIAEEQQDFELIRVIEALRLRASETGSFPLALEEIKSVPVPNDPLTGKAFNCRLSAENAEFNLSKSTLATDFQVVVGLNAKSQNKKGSNNE